MKEWTSFKARRVMSGDEVLEDKYINVLGDEVQSLSDGPETSKFVDLGPHSVVFPGCVNTHAHSFQSLLRGYTNDCDLFEFLEVVYAAAENYSPEDIHRGALLAFQEMVTNGITTVCDFFYLNGRGNENARRVVGAAKEVGIRLNLARSIIDLNERVCVHEDLETGMANYLELSEEFRDDPTVEVSLAPHSVYYSSEEVIAAARDQSRQEGKKWFMHHADSKATRDYALEHFKCSEAQYFHNQGLLDENFVAVHGIWDDKYDIDLLARHGVCVSHNPKSNQFLGEPTAKVPEMMDAGVTVGLGTDGAASNPSLNLFDELRTALLVQKSKFMDPKKMTEDDGVKLATTNGAEIVGFKTGLVAPGYLADFIVCDDRHPTLQPVEKARSHFVYALSPRAISSVYVGGVEVWSEDKGFNSNKR
ncbi:MAG: amidohydrolase family protein [Promethearchaeota archaeon]